MNPLRNGPAGLRAAAMAVTLMLGPAIQAADTPTTPSSAKPAAATVSSMTPEQLAAHLQQHPDHLFVLDVRTPAEYAEGHVPGAVNVPHDQVAARLADIPRDKDVVLYCRSGRRAQAAADVLAAHGYTRLNHLEGDMPAWLERNRPVEK
jgi:phage shock protein E